MGPSVKESAPSGSLNAGPRLGSPLAPGDAVVFRNTSLDPSATGSGTSMVGEPSVGNSGAVVFQSGNWYASLSTSDGMPLTFALANPYTTFPADDGGFCCDQIVVYDPSRDLILWLLQYVNNGIRNRHRLAVASGLDTVVNGFATWSYYDLISDLTFSFTGQWFDFPDISVGNNFLYITTNVFNIAPPQNFTRTVITRLSLDEISDGVPLTINYFTEATRFAFRATQGIKSTAYWATHNSTSSMRIYHWDEGSTSVFWDDINIASWNDLPRTCPGPDGRDMCQRADKRILGATVANNTLTFMWIASQGGSFPFPYVDVARFKEGDRTLIDQAVIWNSNAAWTYPAVSPNNRGHLGISLFLGGGSSFPTHVIGFIDDFAGPPGQFFSTVVSTNGPNRNVWGDYATSRPHSPDGLTWIATGFSLQGGGDDANEVPQFVHFGRQRDARAVNRWTGR